MVDKFDDPLLTPREAARHLLIPRATMYYWLHEQADGTPLVHRVTPEKRGWPSMPFVAVVEAYVLRSLRELGLRKNVIRDAAARVRREFDTPYGLATKRIATDGIDIFVQYAFGATSLSRRAYGALSHVTVQAGIKNVFNSLPPFDALNSPYFYSGYGDPRLRSYQLSLKKGF